MRSTNFHQQPLVLHIIHRLAVGGLENGLMNLVNHMPEKRYRHTIICLTDYTDFRNRIRKKEIPVIALHKREGLDLGLHSRLWKLLRERLPDPQQVRNAIDRFIAAYNKQAAPFEWKKKEVHPVNPKNHYSDLRN
jgi:hypothetical protein